MHLQEAGNAQTLLQSQDGDIANFFLSANKMQIRILSLGIFCVKRRHFFPAVFLSLVHIDSSYLSNPV